MKHDLWFAWRRLMLRPLHSATVALTLGLGIGASLAVFAIVDAVLLRPLPYAEAGQLISIRQIIPGTSFGDISLSDVAYRRIAEQSRALAAVAAWDTRDANLVDADATRRLVVAQVAAPLFEVLRMRPALGRAFTTMEALPGGPRVLLLADWLWRAAFNADSSVIGRGANLEGEAYTIVGVLPAWVSFPSREVGAWEPLLLDPAASAPYDNRFTLLGRLRDGVTLAQAQRDITTLIQAVGREYPGPHPGSRLDPAGWLADLTPLAETVVGEVRPVILLVLGGVVLLLALTCANVANLQLAGATLRAEELAVRASLGATRRRLITGALLEGMLLSSAGGVIGLALAVGGARLLSALMPADVASGGGLASARLLLVTAAIVLLIGGAIGALPVALITGRDPARGLRDRAAGASPIAARRARRLLAAAQVALAILLLHGSGLLIASARSVQRTSLGFDPDAVVTMRINLPDRTLRDRNAREALLRRLVSDVGALPGVVSAGLVNALPLTQGREDQAMAVEGRPFAADGTDPVADYRVVSAGYFSAMDISLVRGRLFTDDDANERSTPLVISQALANRLFPDGDDPLGRRLKFGPVAPWMPIIGVVEDAKNRSLTQESRPEFYVPGLGSFASMAFRTEITIVARARGDASRLIAPIREIIRSAAPDVAVYQVLGMNEVVREARARMTIVTRLMTLYAGAALLLALAGTYAVLAYLVAQRQRELAVRMALGASPKDVVLLVGRESALLVGGGAAFGLLGAALAARLLSGLLYGVGPLDVRVLGVIALLAAVTGVLAALTPARQALRVDPSTTLRR